jgi:outer membrane protein TolC
VALVSHQLEPLAVQSAPLSLTLDDAIAAALARNPNLIAMRAGEPVAQAAYHVAETYPWNPFVQVQVLPYAKDPLGLPLDTNHYVWLMQTLELAHQRRHREASAAAAWNQIRWNIVQAELTSAAQAERFYFTALYQRDLRDLAAHTASLSAELLGIVERRFQAGLATAAERTTARVTARQSDKQAALAEANFQTALLALRRQLNLSGDDPIVLVGRLEEFAWLPALTVVSRLPDDGTRIAVPNDLAASLASERPDVLAADAGVGAARANADLARANRIPNLGIGPFYERDEVGTVFAGLRTQMNLPVWDTGRPLARQREAEFQQQAIGVEQLRTRAMVEVQTALERYERARRLVARERSDAARTIPDELERIKDQFEAGQADILNVFATQNGLFQERRTFLDLLNELAQSAAELTLAAGLPPARLVTSSPYEPARPEALPPPDSATLHDPTSTR